MGATAKLSCVSLSSAVPSVSAEILTRFNSLNLGLFGPGLLATHGELASHRKSKLEVHCMLNLGLGERHRKQRNLLNPIFTTAHMRYMLPIFQHTVERVSVSVVSSTHRSLNGLLS